MSRLKRLSVDRPSKSDIESAMRLLEDESPRSAAIVAAAFLEDVAQLTLQTRMIDLSKEEKDRIFVGAAPLGSFSAKIQALFALGIVGRKVRHDLDCMREIRNAFAHAKISIDFETPAISDSISGLHCLSLLAPIPTSARMRFASATRLLLVHLIGTWPSTKDPIPDEWKNFDPPDKISEQSVSP